MANEQANTPARDLQLEVLDTEYQVFKENQVLTHENLNEITKFFEAQSRLTRTALIGVGIVCGLRTKLVGHQIIISQGMAVTTDGDLIYMDETSYEYFRAYDNTAAHYEPFFTAPDKQIELYELVLRNPNGQYPLNSYSLSEFNNTAKKTLAGMCVLLYVEYFLKEPTLCTTIDCNNQGYTQINKLRVLLISKDDLEKVIKHEKTDEAEKKTEIADDLYSDYNFAFEELYKQPDLRPKRVIIDKVATSHYQYLTKAFLDIAISDIERVALGLKKLLEPFEFLLKTPLINNIEDRLKKIAKETESTNDKLYSQYLYDFSVDLITAYNELHEILHNLVIKCGPGLYNFPKHIMLGELGAELLPAPVAYRHLFYPSPAVTKNKEKLIIANAMVVRLNKMIRSFFVPQRDLVHGIHITPSMDAGSKLEDRAIPFYYHYNPDEKKVIAEGNYKLPGTTDFGKIFKREERLLHYWNYGKTLRNLEKTIYSYYFDYYGNFKDDFYEKTDSNFNNPLAYNFDPCNFFRIEGHLGKEFNFAMKEIDTMRKTNNLPFDLVAVRLGNPKLSDLDLEDYQCEFEDLVAILRAWKKEQACLRAIIIKFFSGFSASPSLDVPAHNSLDRMNDYVGLIYDRAIRRVSEEEISTNSTVPDPSATEQTAITIGLFIPPLDIKINRPEEIINAVNVKAAQDIEFSKLPDDEKEVILKTPVAVIAHLTDAAQYIPESISQINPVNVILFKDRMKALCHLLQTARSRTENIFARTGYVRRGYEQQYLYMLGMLASNCCAGEKLEEIYNEIERRKQKILQSVTLAKYAADHPGLEHKAGVHRGGTFVLVYAAKNKRKKTIEKASPKTETANIKDESELLNDHFIHYFRENESELKKLKDKSPELFDRISGLVKLAPFETIEDLVIADFCLPYACRSNCPPVAFIFEKTEETFSLRLPVPKICSNAGPQKFEVSPAGGIVKTTDPAGQYTILEKDGAVYFDPGSVKPADYERTFQFTVNDKPTGCTIIVYQHPEAKIDFEVLDENPKSITIEFRGYSNEPANKVFEYNWSFGDNQTDKGSRTKVFFKKEYFKDRIPVKLDVVNGPCSNQAAAEVPFTTPEQLILAMKIKEVCNSHEPIYFDAYSPKGAVIGPPELSYAIIPGDNPAFDPRKITDPALFGVPVKFTMNGQPTDCSITVFPKPVPQFTVNGPYARTEVSPFPTSGNLIEKKDDFIQIGLTNTTVQHTNEILKFEWNIFNTDKSYLYSPGNNELNKPFSVRISNDDIKKYKIEKLFVELRVYNQACYDELVTPVDLSCHVIIYNHLVQLREVNLIDPLKYPGFPEIKGGQYDMFYKSLIKAYNDGRELYKTVLSEIKPGYVPSDEILSKIRVIMDYLKQLLLDLKDKKPENDKENVNAKTIESYMAQLFFVSFVLLINVLRCSKVTKNIPVDIKENTFGYVIDFLLRKFIFTVKEKGRLFNIIINYVDHGQSKTFISFLQNYIIPYLNQA